MNYAYSNKGKPVSCELTPGEQLVLIKENLSRAAQYKLDTQRPLQVGEIIYLAQKVKDND